MATSASQEQERRVPEEVEMPATETDKAKYIACAEIMPGCSFTSAADTEQELMQKVADHAAQVHGMTEITPDLAAKVKAAIKSR